MVGTDDALRRLSPEMLATCLSHLQEAFALFSPVHDAGGGVGDFRVDYANPAAGLPATEQGGATPEPCLSQCLGASARQLIVRLTLVLQTGEPWETATYPAIDVAVNGGGRWVDVRAWRVGQRVAMRWRPAATGERPAEAALHASEARERQRAEELSRILDAVPAGTWIAHDPQCRSITGSRFGHELLKLPEGANLSKTAPDHERPNHFRVFRADGREYDPADLPMQKAAATGEPQRNVRFDMLFDDGSRKSVFGNAEPLFDEAGKPRGAVSAFVDITELVDAEARLRERERQLDLVMNTAPVLIAHCDANCRYRFVNDAYARRFGLSASEVVGRHVKEVVGENAFAEVEPKVRDVLAGREVLFETRVELPVLGTRYMDARYAPEIDEDGRVRGFVAVVTDITERVEAERGMREARDEAQRRAREAEERQRLLSAMMEHIPMGITIADAPDVNIRAVSRHGRELVDRPREQIENIAADLHVERWQVFRGDGQTPASEGELPLTRAVRQGEVVRGEVWTVSRADGTKVPILCNAAPIHDGDGRIVGGVIGWQDITERREAEQALRESEQRFREAFEQSAAGLKLCDPDGRFVDVNGRLTEMLGRTRDELLSMRFQDVTHPDDVEAEVALYAKLTSGAIDQYSLRKRFLRPDGSVVWVQLSVSVRRDEDGPMRYSIGAVQDITAQVEAERKLQEVNVDLEARVRERTEQVRERSEQIRQMAVEVIEAEERERHRLAVQLHDDLQQMLAAIRMRIGMLRGDVPATRRQAWQGLDELVGQTIASTRSLAVELCPPVLRNAGLVRALEWLSGHYQEQHQLTVHVEASTDAEPSDEDLATFLFRAARELLFNVVKHAQTSEACVRLDLHEGQARLVVSDRGRGAVTVSGSGTGLGLFSLAERAERLGGTSHIDTSPGEGCRVTLTVPLKKP